MNDINGTSMRKRGIIMIVTEAGSFKKYLDKMNRI